ncbi:MAG: hypothetical protein GQF41_2946 [Candidatus Rifleibacterium amylolyticum]|nr:MAG: hypothetical protein GQF41_2946 [Candidatus Rifleibacterium amylolyticum]
MRVIFSILEFLPINDNKKWLLVYAGLFVLLFRVGSTDN